MAYLWDNVDACSELGQDTNILDERFGIIFLYDVFRYVLPRNKNIFTVNVFVEGGEKINF